MIFHRSLEQRSRLSFTVLMIFIVAGCTPFPANPADTVIPTAAVLSTATAFQTASPATTPANLKNNSPVVIRVGTGESGEQINTHQMIIQAYENTHKNVMVQMDAIAGTDYYARVMTLSEAKRSPDILIIGDDYVPFFVDKGMFTPLDNLLENAGFDKTNYLPGLLEPGQVDGKQYFLPFDYSTLALYYNKKLFDEAQLPYPTEDWDWNDLLSAAHKLTRDKDGNGIPEQYGIQMNANWDGGFEYWVAAAGGRLISQDGTKIVGYMDSPETIRALQFYSDLYHKYRVAPPPVDLNAWAGGNTEFDDGTAAMVIFGRWTQAGYLLNPRIDLGVSSPPGDKIRANILFWNGCGISSSSETAPQSTDFLTFYTGEGGAEFWQEDHLPVLKTTASHPTQLMELIDHVWISELNHLVPRAYLSTPFWEETARIPLRNALSIAVTDPDANIADILKAAARQAQKDLDNYLQ